MSIRSLFDRSLFLRTTTILLGIMILIVLVLQLLLRGTFIYRISPDLLEAQVASVTDIVSLLDVVPVSSVPAVLSAFSGPSRAAVLRDTFPEKSIPSQIRGRPFLEATTDAPGSAPILEERYRIISKVFDRSADKQYSETNVFGPLILEVSIRLKDDRILSILLSEVAIFGPIGIWILLGTIAQLVIATVISLIFVFRPLKKLEYAAQTIGRTSQPVIVKEDGTDDLRRVARAMNDMQLRVKSLLAERSQMLAALAHDIRTCLTHMKLRLDHIEPRQSAPFEADIDQMGHLISDMLLYASAEQPTSQPELIEINGFLDKFAATLPYAIETSFAKQHFWIAADRGALTRALSNLVDNAITYGESPALRSKVEVDYLTIVVEDNGAGIPEEALERIFDPFYRVEPSRSRNTGGTGLGLTIARALLSAQGATLALENRKVGGTRAVITFSNVSRIE